MSSTQFVGRERELGQLHDSLDRMLAGQGQVVLLAGEPGIGKTRLAEEIIAEAGRRDVRVLWGRCFEWEGAPAFWPWIQLIRGYVRDCDERILRDQLGAGAAHVAQIEPSIREYLPDLPDLPDMDPEESRFRLFDSVVTMLRNSAAERPLAIFLDDLHWADAPSLLLLQFLVTEVRASRLLVLGTYRPAEVDSDHLLGQVLAELAREPTYQRISLTGLQRRDVGRFISLTSGTEPPNGLLDAVHRETGGNPFFMTEVVRLLYAEGALVDQSSTTSWHIQIPESVRETIGRRLGRLSSACMQMLAAAAVIGREFNITILEPASSMNRLMLLELLDEAIAADIVREDGVAGHYRFSHVLIQEVLYQQITSARRVQIHRDVGIALERIHEADLTPHLPELAHHFLQAAPAGDRGRAVVYATRAGDHAMNQVAWESAAEHYQRALLALDLEGAADPLQYCELLLALGEAQNRIGAGSGDAPEARRTFFRAAEIARTLGAANHFARAALGYAGFNVVVTFGGLQQVQLLEDALVMLGDGDSKQKTRVLSRLAMDLATVGETSNLERVRALGDEAVAMARRLDDPGTLAFALAARHFSGWGPDNLEDRLADAVELANLVEVAGDLLTTAWAHMIQLEDLVESGNLHSALREADALTMTGERYRAPYITLRAAVYRAMLLLMTGQFTEAERLIQEGETLWQSSAIRQHQFQLFVLRREQGRLEELRETIEEAGEGQITGIARYSHLALAHLPVLYLEIGQEARARERFEVLAARDFKDIPFDLSWLSVLGLLSDACVQLGDTHRAERLYSLLLPHAEQNAVLGISAACHGSVSYYLGLLATGLERWGTALGHIDDALAMHERMEMYPYIAHTHMARAEVLRRRHLPGDLEAALEAAMLSKKMASSLGMTVVAQRAATLVDTLTGHPVTEIELTPREARVLLLVSRGLTDAGISTELGISPRTVNSHMRSIFSKLEVHSRAAATRVAVERGLLDPDAQDANSS